MTEKEFLTLYKERRNLKSMREAREEIFNLIAEVITMDEEVKLKNKEIFLLLKK